MRKHIDEATMLAAAISAELQDHGYHWGTRPPRDLIREWPGYYRFCRKYRNRRRSAIIATVWVHQNLRHWYQRG